MQANAAMTVGWIVGVVMGVGIAWLLPGPPLPASSAPAAPTPTADGPVPRAAPRAGTPPVGTEPTAALDVCRFELEAARGQLAMLGGASTPWPADIPPAVGRDHIEEWFESNRRLVDETGEDGALDCSEFPCVLTVFMANSHTSGDLARLRESFREQAGDGFVGRTFLSGGPEGASHAMAITPVDWDPTPPEAKRLQVRMEALTEP